jgi:hypothetical protein
LRGPERDQNNQLILRLPLNACGNRTVNPLSNTNGTPEDGFPFKYSLLEGTDTFLMCADDPVCSNLEALASKVK